MLERIRANRPLQLALALLFGAGFGFLLQKGGVTRYEIIVGQLLLIDWTVVKVMMTAVLVGMLGVQALIAFGLADHHRKEGSLGRTVIGGLLFGFGFGLLGYCPGTGMGAVGQGSLDALFGGVVGMILGAASFAAAYPRLKESVLRKGRFGEVALSDVPHLPRAAAVAAAAVLILAILWTIERLGG